MKISLTLGLTLAFVTSCPAAVGDEEDRIVVPTTLTAIRETPHAFRNVWVTFPVQFASLGSVQNPFFTRFVPSRFANFHCWADEQPIWRRKQYGDMFGLLFLSKDSEQLQELFTLETYQRLQITGIVRNTFQGSPWIEVSSFAPLGEGVSTATLAHLYRGEQLMKKHRWSLAISEFSLAPMGEVPPEVRAEVHKNLGICHLRKGESDAAVAQLSEAKSLSPRPDHELERLLEVARTRPETELDRAVDRKQVDVHERPLWEAFENVGKPEPRPVPGR